MDSNADEIRRAVAELRFAPQRFRPVADQESVSVYESARKHFIPSGNPSWWWEHFPKSESAHLPNGAALQRLLEVVPDPDERVWFIAEDFVAPQYSVWEATVRDIQATLLECYGFEYYLVQKDFRWLVCENHHEMLIGVGDEVEERFCPELGGENNQ
jgi:hypothetical protein